MQPATSENGLSPAESSGAPAREQTNSYRIAREIELSVAAKAHAAETSWRRIAFLLGGLLAIAIVAIIVLMGKTQHDVLVYRDDGRTLHVMSEGVSTRTPSQRDVASQIARWLQWLRDVPGSGDYDAVDRDIHAVLASTAKNSHAAQQITDFYRVQNPKVLSATLSRTVTDVQVSSYTANTYGITWTESLRMSGNQKVVRQYTGRVTIANPQIPNDPALGLLNPAGVFITDFDLPWSNP